MNTVLFLVYLAGVVGGLKTALGVIAGALIGVPTLIWFFTVGIQQEKANAAARMLSSNIKWAILVLFVSAVIPQKSFLYVAAGLSAGSEVAQTDIAQKAYTLLEQRIDALIGEAGE